MNATIRVRVDDDLAACAEALTQVHRLDGYPVEGVADPVGWLSPPELLCSWVAELQGAIVGHVSASQPREEDAVTIWIDRSGASVEQVAVLARLFVLPGSRGQALGERLTKEAMAYAEEIGRRLVLDVMEKDQAAIRLYERLGWQQIGATTHTFDDSPGAPAYCYISPQLGRS